MAYINNIEIIEQDKTKHKEVEAVCYIFYENNKKIFQIDTVGSKDRKLKGKTSQTIQFDEDFIKKLYKICNNK